MYVQAWTYNVSHWVKSTFTFTFYSDYYCERIVTSIFSSLPSSSEIVLRCESETQSMSYHIACIFLSLTMKTELRFMKKKDARISIHIPYALCNFAA